MDRRYNEAVESVSGPPHRCPALFAENAELSLSYGFRSKGPNHSSIASQFQERAQRLLRFDNALQDPTAVPGAI